MADNVVITAGSGTTVHADEYTHTTLGSGKTQLVKLVDGTLDSETAIAAGGGVEAGALRVTIANDSTGVLSIDDGGGAITVDNGGTFAVQSTLQANSGVDIGDVDVTSVIPGTAATNLGKAIDSAVGGTDTGVALLAMRDDTLSSLTPAEGDWVQLRVNANGALHVTGSAGSTQYSEDAAHTTGDTLTGAGVVRVDSAASLCGSDGDYTLLQVDSAGALRVTGGGGGTEYNEDAATPATITGTATVMERDDALSTLTPIEGDWAAMRCSAEGALWVQEFNSDAILADTASMDTNLGTIAGAVTGTEMQVDIVADGAGLATAANQTTIIGHVDGIEGLLTTIDADTSNLSVVGGGTEAAAIRVTIANDSTGVLSIDDNGATLSIDDGGGAITVDGTVTANLSATDNAVLDNIDADTSNIQTAVEIMDDWDAVHDSAASSDGVQLMAAYDSTKPTAVGDGDAVRVLADASGRLLAGVEPERFQATITSADATSATQVKAKTAAKQIHILSLIVSTDTAMNIQFQDDAGSPAVLVEQMYFAANGGAVLTFPPEAPLVVATNQDLDVLASASGNISVTATGYLMS